MKYSIALLSAALILGSANSAIGQGSSAASEKSDNLVAASSASQTALPALQNRNPRYQLRKGDSFDLDFAFSPELNQTVEVQPDGYVTLKDIGSIYVEGQTVPELTETLKSAYATILHEPVITVALKDFEKPYFIASGQVDEAGQI